MPLFFRLRSAALAGVLLAFIPLTVHAQGSASVVRLLPETAGPQIIGEEQVQVGRKTIFRAAISEFSASTSTLNYVWRYSDAPDRPERGVESVHTFMDTGTFTVALEIRTAEGTQQEVAKEVFVYDKKIFLVTDTRQRPSFQELETAAAREGNALTVIATAQAESSFLTEDRLVQLFTEHTPDLMAADMIIFHTSASHGLQAFARFVHTIKPEEREQFRTTVYASITDREFQAVRWVAQQAFAATYPRALLLVHSTALPALVQAKKYDQITTALRTADIAYLELGGGENSPAWHVLWRLLAYFIGSGVSASVLYLMVVIPLIVFITVFARQVLGMPTFGVYAPVMTAAALFMLGITLGLLTFVFVVAVSYVVKYVLNRSHLLYLSKVGLNLALLSLSFLGLVAIFVARGNTISLSFAIFPMLLMSTIAEKFMAAQSEEGWRNAVLGVFSTLLLAVGSYFAITAPIVLNFIQSWPETVVAVLLLIFLLGKFTGLRLDEYFRFRTLLRDRTVEE